MRLFNPSKNSFSTTYDINGNGSPLMFTIDGLDFADFNDIVGEHMKKHLADFILNERGIKTNAFDDLDKIKREIEVSDEL
jgi:hypothetical protein